MSSQVDRLRAWRQNAYEKQNYVTAELLADKILSFTEAHTDAYWLAQIYYGMGNYLRGAHLLKSREFTKKDLKCRYVAARCSLKANKVEEGLDMIHEAEFPEPGTVQTSPDDPEATLDWAYLRFVEGELFTAQNNFEAAKNSYEQAVLLDSACFEAFEKLSTQSLLTPSAELNLFNRANFSQFGDAEDLMKSLYAINLPQQAIPNEVAYDALSLLKDEYSLRDNTSIMTVDCNRLYTQNFFEQCRRLCEQILERDPYNYAVYPSYVASLQELNERTLLYKISHELVANAPTQPVAWFAVGVYYMSAGQIQESRRHFSKATQMNPYFSEAWLGFAHTFANEGEHEQAIMAYSTAARLFPGSFVPYMYLGMQHLHLNNISLAEEYLLTAIGMYADDPLLLNEYGVIFYQREELEKARSIFERAAQLVKQIGSHSPSWAAIKVNLGQTTRRLGMLDKARTFFQEAIFETTNNHDALSALALVELDSGNVEAAIELLNEALAISRESPITSDLLKRAVAKSLKQTPVSQYVRRREIDIDVQNLQD